MPVVKNYLKLCVNHQFITPSLYNQITQLISITDIFMYHAFWRHALFVRGQSFSVKIFDKSRGGCQVIRLGEGDNFGGPSGQAFVRARSLFLAPITSQRLLRRLIRIDLLKSFMINTISQIINSNHMIYMIK